MQAYPRYGRNAGRREERASARTTAEPSLQRSMAPRSAQLEPRNASEPLTPFAAPVCGTLDCTGTCLLAVRASSGPPGGRVGHHHAAACNQADMPD